MKNYLAIVLIAISFLASSVASVTGQSQAAAKFEDQKFGKPVAAADSTTGVAPSNDNYDSASPIVVGGVDIIAVNGTNVDASKEQNEPNHADNIGGRSVWYTLTSDINKVVELRTISPNTTFDTTLAVYKGNILQYLTPVVANDDCYRAECSTQSRVRMLMKAGVIYHVAVDGYNNGGGGTSTGNFALIVDQQTGPFEYDAMETAYDVGVIFNRVNIGGTNHFATGQPSEPQHSGGNTGSHSVWYRFKVSSSHAMKVSIKEDFDNEIAVYSTLNPNPTMLNLNKLDNSADHIGYGGDVSSCTFMARAGYYYYIAIDHNTDNNSGDGITGNFQLKIEKNNMRYGMRLDGWDEFGSIGVYRPANNTWYLLADDNPAEATYKKFGISGDTPMPADYDGDDITDIAVTRNLNGQKHWYFLEGYDDNGYYTHLQWGLSIDKEIVGDFDGDGVADPTVIRNQNGSLVWYVRKSSNLSMRTFVFGLNNDRPVVGDFDGDGATEVAVVRDSPQGLVWYIAMSDGNGAYTDVKIVPFGLANDLPAVQDFDGDGKSDISLFRPSDGNWYILRSGTGELQVTHFGAATDVPQPTDIDDDGKSELVVYRLTTGVWYIWYSESDTQNVVAWGKPGDKALASMNRFSLPESNE